MTGDEGPTTEAAAVAAPAAGDRAAAHARVGRPWMQTQRDLVAIEYHVWVRTKGGGGEGESGVCGGDERSANNDDDASTRRHVCPCAASSAIAHIFADTCGNGSTTPTTSHLLDRCLHAAIALDDVVLVRHLLARGASLHYRGPRTSFHALQLALHVRKYGFDVHAGNTMTNLLSVKYRAWPTVAHNAHELAQVYDALQSPALLSRAIVDTCATPSSPTSSPSRTRLALALWWHTVLETPRGTSCISTLVAWYVLVWLLLFLAHDVLFLRPIVLALDALPASTLFSASAAPLDASLVLVRYPLLLVCILAWCACRFVRPSGVSAAAAAAATRSAAYAQAIAAMHQRIVESSANALVDGSLPRRSTPPPTDAVCFSCRAVLPTGHTPLDRATATSATSATTASHASAPTIVHCHRCSRCVIDRDHHCWWLDTCIAAHNMSAFLTFLVATSVLGLLHLYVVSELFAGWWNANASANANAANAAATTVAAIFTSHLYPRATFPFVPQPPSWTLDVVHATTLVHLGLLTVVCAHQTLAQSTLVLRRRLSAVPRERERQQQHED